MPTCPMVGRMELACREGDGARGHVKASGKLRLGAAEASLGWSLLAVRASPLR